MNIKSCIPILLVILLVITACKHTAVAQKEIQSDKHITIIYPKHPFETGKPFMPDSDQVQLIEKLVEVNLNGILATDGDTSSHALDNKKNIKDNIDQYHRRYFGWVNAVGEKIMLVEFIHPIGAGNNDSWKSANWSMDGGAYLFWSVEYNLNKHSFDKLWINADM